MLYQTVSEARAETARWPMSAILLLVFGATLVVLGFYFVFLRPALLPEDLRYFGASPAQLESAAPELAIWLKQVFRVMGGYIAATGALTMTLAATSFRARQPIAIAGALIGGAVSIGWMVIVNFMINSDYKWPLFALAILWACSLGRLWFEADGPSR